MQRYVLGFLTTLLLASPAAAQSKRGTWNGFARANGDSWPLVVVLDSAASGWNGAAVSPQTGGDSLRLVSVSIRADTLSFGIPYNGNTVYIEGLVAAGKFSGGMWVGNNAAGSVELTRKTPAGEKPK